MQLHSPKELKDFEVSQESALLCGVPGMVNSCITSETLDLPREEITAVIAVTAI